MSSYYNENDANTAAWLRELIKDGEIPSGEVDERSIVDVEPVDLAGFNQHHFFAGVAGWELALRLAGWDDRRPVWTASLPCQPFSPAGKSAGAKDERHLWPVFGKLVRECQPATVFGEQVAAKDGRAWFSAVRADLEGMGYAAGGSDLCAAGIGAPHIRQRIYWCAIRQQGALSEGDRPGATADASGRIGTCGLGVANRAGREQGRTPAATARHRGPVEPTGGAGGLAHGSSKGLEVECEQPAREELATIERGSAVGGLGHSERELARGDARASPEAQGGAPVRAECDDFGSSVPACGLPDTERNGLYGSRNAGAAGRDESANSQWDDVVYLPCIDGKARPIQGAVESTPERVAPGFSPLVVRGGDQGEQSAEASAEGRVMRLRGYGNAIVPQLAAVFIKTVMEY